MKKKERLLATLNGKTVDRPPVSFYEINGVTQDSKNSDPFNVYSHPSWKPLLELALEKTDLIVMKYPGFTYSSKDSLSEITKKEVYIKGDSRYTAESIKIGNRVLKQRWRQDKDVNTVWSTEHLLKDVDDIKAFLQIPHREFRGFVDTSEILKVEEKIGDDGIVMLGCADPICMAASIFDMSDYTILALTEQKIFHQLLEYFAEALYREVEAVSKALPGRLWRVVGPEYASVPYLPPSLFREYVIKYDQPIVDIIQKYNGYARMHSHGNLKAILDDIASLGVDGLDPIEPPPQGDVELKYVREKYGKDMVLFGNIEASDISNLTTNKFEEKVKIALEEGTYGEGRGFVLLPSACPYGRVLPKQALNNYETMVRLTEQF